jgi:hypothetical protein
MTMLSVAQLLRLAMTTVSGAELLVIPSAARDLAYLQKVSRPGRSDFEFNDSTNAFFLLRRQPLISFSREMASLGSSKLS